MPSDGLVTLIQQLSPQPFSAGSWEPGGWGHVTHTPNTLHRAPLSSFLLCCVWNRQWWELGIFYNPFPAAGQRGPVSILVSEAVPPRLVLSVWWQSANEPKVTLVGSFFSEQTPSFSVFLHSFDLLLLWIMVKHPGLLRFLQETCASRLFFPLGFLGILFSFFSWHPLLIIT